MSTDESELFQFSEFVTGKLQIGSAALTPEECFDPWRLQHPAPSQYRRNVEAVQSAIDEMENGTAGVAADERHAQMRFKFQAPKSTESTRY